MKFDELKDMVFEHLSEIASREYIVARDDPAGFKKSHVWLDYVIAVSGDGSFSEWLFNEDDLLSTADFLQVIEYISEYHAQRNMDNGSMLELSLIHI